MSDFTACTHERVGLCRLRGPAAGDVYNVGCTWTPRHYRPTIVCREGGREGGVKLAAEAVAWGHTGVQAVATDTGDWIQYSGKLCC